MARTVGFEDVNEASVEELFQSHMEDHINVNILELKKEVNDEDEESSIVKPVKYLWTKQITTFFNHTDTAVSNIDDYYETEENWQSSRIIERC